MFIYLLFIPSTYCTYLFNVIYLPILVHIIIGIYYILLSPFQNI